MRQLIVDLGERSYPIYIGEGLLEQAAQLFGKHAIPVKSPIMIVTDESIAPLYLGKLQSVLEGAGYTVHSFSVPSGETSKSLEMYERVMTAAIQAGLDRHSSIIALGGGVTGDLAGFVAATYMRGIRFIQCPTTILAHDSSVGGKVAVNHKLAKNMIGAFHQPEMVIYDTLTLKTLPMREVRSGLSEVIKHGLIWDRGFVDWCREHAEQLLHLDSEALAYALYEGCKVKSYVVSQDERESGLRAILNLGHTIGHALEAVAGYNELVHGEAIAIGMVGSALLSQRFGYESEIHRITKQLFERFGLPVQIPAHMETDAILEAMMHDKKFKEGQMVFVIPVHIGKVEIRSDVKVEWVREVIEQLKGKERA
ncbi:3-dehydroquinate synthase [Marinicrinis lubricantis]|uniref:3-dehydroquinate synthase n=1 Tax=Marinicrinis lubricantis TaxID=2086470 RepID=A0ABW1IM21_9BACL